MGIMNFVKKFAENKKAKGEKFKTMQENDRLETMLEERKKSANQRELEDHFKKEDEKRIKEALNKVRKQQNKTNWKGDSILKGGTSMLHQDKSVMNDGNSILKQKNIFKGGNSILNQKNIFRGKSKMKKDTFNDNKINNPVTGDRMFFK